jgi:transcriptional regulator with XRE-family HTH domain
MKAQAALQKILITRYEELRMKNPHYSQRAFSKRLGLSAGATNEVFRGRRKVSLKIASQIAERLNLDPQERAELFSAYPKVGEPVGKEDPMYLQLSVDQFKVIGDWYHFAILTLMRSKGFKSDPTWIARRLRLSRATASSAIELLKRLGMIQEDFSGKLTRSKTRYRTSDDVSNFSVRKAHSDYLQNARQALDEIPVGRRDFTSLMMSLDLEQLPKIKERIRVFQDELSKEFETKPNREVFQLLVQLFPLTQIQEEEPGK